MNRPAPSDAPLTRAQPGPAAPRPPYASNATLEQIAQRLTKASRTAILTHAKPDGDAVGGTLALARTLHRRGAQAWPVYLPPWPARMDPVVGATPVIHEKHGVWHHAPLDTVDTVAIIDTGSWNQVADARAWLEPRRDLAVLIDHHAHGDADIAATRHVDPTSASASELVAQVCRHLLDLRSPAQFPLEIAEPLYLGLATDTGWFRYSNMTARTLRLAADLIDAGVDHNRLYRRIEQSDSPMRLRFIQRALAGLELLDHARVAIIAVSKADIDACQATQDEIGGLTDLPQSVGTVQVVAVLTELEAQLTKISLRSKAADPGQPFVDVNLIAQTLGGGGHAHAAGAKLHLALPQARQRVIDAIAAAPPTAHP